jgi:hypothetical protein
MFKLIVIHLHISYFQISPEVEWVRMFCHPEFLFLSIYAVFEDDEHWELFSVGYRMSV